MKKLLIKFEANWADEMDIEGLFVITEAEWTLYKQKATAYFKTNNTLNYCIGSNEDIEFYSYTELMEAFTVVSEDIYNSGLGILDTVSFLPIGYTGPEYFDEDEDDKEDENAY